jgi:hypothetical protein
MRKNKATYEKSTHTVIAAFFISILKKRGPNQLSHFILLNCFSFSVKPYYRK